MAKYDGPQGFKDGPTRRARAADECHGFTFASRNGMGHGLSRESGATHAGESDTENLQRLMLTEWVA